MPTGDAFEVVAFDSHMALIARRALLALPDLFILICFVNIDR